MHFYCCTMYIIIICEQKFYNIRTQSYYALPFPTPPPCTTVYFSTHFTWTAEKSSSVAPEKACSCLLAYLLAGPGFMATADSCWLASWRQLKTAAFRSWDYMEMRRSSLKQDSFAGGVVDVFYA